MDTCPSLMRETEQKYLREALDILCLGIYLCCLKSSVFLCYTEDFNFKSYCLIFALHLIDETRRDDPYNPQ